MEPKSWLRMVASTGALLWVSPTLAEERKEVVPRGIDAEQFDQPSRFDVTVMSQEETHLPSRDAQASEAKKILYSDEPPDATVAAAAPTGTVAVFSSSCSAALADPRVNDTLDGLRDYKQIIEIIALAKDLLANREKIIAILTAVESGKAADVAEALRLVLIDLLAEHKDEIFAVIVNSAFPPEVASKLIKGAEELALYKAIIDDPVGYIIGFVLDRAFEASGISKYKDALLDLASGYDELSAAIDASDATKIAKASTAIVNDLEVVRRFNQTMRFFLIGKQWEVLGDRSLRTAVTSVAPKIFRKLFRSADNALRDVDAYLGGNIDTLVMLEAACGPSWCGDPAHPPFDVDPSVTSNWTTFTCYVPSDAVEPSCLGWREYAVSPADGCTGHHSRCCPLP